MGQFECSTCRGTGRGFFGGTCGACSGRGETNAAGAIVALFWALAFIALVVFVIA